MSVDKFGRTNIDRGASSNSSHLLSPYRHGFIFTEDGNIDVENLKLSNVKSPTNDKDVSTKRYVDDSLTSLNKELHTFIEKYSKDTIQELEHKYINNIYLKISDVDGKVKTFSESLEIIKKLIYNEVENLRNEFLNQITILSNDRTIIITDLSNKISNLTTAVELNTLNLNKISNLDLSAKIMSVEKLTKNIERELNQFRDTVTRQMSEVYLDMTNNFKKLS